MEHYFTNNDNIKSITREIKFHIHNKDFTFYTDNGVFSKSGLDFGTRTLLEVIPILKIKGKVLDFGCGYGPIGIILSKLTNCQVDMIDVNIRAIGLSYKNAKINDVSVNVFESDIYSEVKEKYNYIITNPPIRVGKKILYQILFEAKNHLEADGEVWFVINKDQGAKSLMRDLANLYDVRLVKKNKGFYIICLK